MIYPDLNFKPRLSVINDEQIEQIHLATLELLERTGVKISHPRALDVLEDSGARVNGDRVRIPSWMVEDAIRTSPSRVVLGLRNGERSVFLEGDKSCFGPSLDCLDYLDPVTNERRAFTLDDCRITATVADALPNYAFTMTIGMATDTKPSIADRLIARQAMTYCEKPLVFCCNDLNNLKDIYEMALLISGSDEQFQQAPTIVHYSEAISPLLHFDPAIDKLFFCAEKGIPLICLSAPMAGSTGPATFAGTVVQGSAESLSCLVLAQLVRPGSSFIYGSQTTIMDMATTIFSYGAPEKSMMIAAVAQMAQHYRLPFFGTAGCSDAKHPDSQAAAEAAFSCLSSALSGANLIHDSGWLDHGSIASPGYMVLVNDVIQMVKQYMKGMPVNDETLALDLIDKVGLGGHYLEEEHTLKHYRDVWYSRLFDRTVNAQWIEQGSKDFEERLREQTLKVMEHKPAPLSPAVIKELDQMAKHWE